MIGPRIDRRTLLGTLHSSIEVLLACGAVVVAALAFAPFFLGPRWLLPVVGAAVAGGALAAAPQLRRRGGWLVALVGVLGLAIYDLYSFHADQTLYGLPTPEALRGTLDDLVSGWARVLTIAVPADSVRDLVAFPTTVTFVGAFVASTLVLRSPLVVGLGAPAVLVLVVGLGVTAGRTDPAIGVTVMVLALLTLLVLVRANRVAVERSGTSRADATAIGVDLAAERRHSTLGRVLFGLPGAVVVLALAAGGALALPLADGSDREDPRAVYRPEVDERLGLSPLSLVRPQLAAREDADPLYRVRVRAPDGVEVAAIRIAALERFDGALWTQDGQFVRAGTQLPRSRATTLGPAEVRLEVEVLARFADMLPVVGEPVTLRQVEARVEEASGTLLLPAPTAQQYPFEYRLTAEVPRSITSETAAVPDPAPARLTALPDAPDWVSTVATSAVPPDGTPWEQLTALRDDLLRGGYNEDAKPGHSYGALARLLDAQAAEPGYAEQYASAFAVLARELHYAARVAVGYRLATAERDGDAYLVGPSDAHAWPEVLFEGYGWVAFEPTPFENFAVVPAPRPLPSPSTNIVAQDDEGDAASVTGDGEGGVGAVLSAAVLVTALVLGALAVVLALAVWGIALAKAARRHRRRTTGEPAQRIAAAWREVTDGLREHGITVPAAQTPWETADRTAVGAAVKVHAEIERLADIATCAVCHPVEPTLAEAREAWRLEAAIRTALRAGMPPVRRFLAAVDPRPLLPRRRTAERSAGVVAERTEMAGVR